MASRYQDFHAAGKDKNKLITNRAEWAGITVDKDDNDPRDKDTLIKTLIDLKSECIKVERCNGKMRTELDKANVNLIRSGMRERQAADKPEVQARLFGKFAFKEKNSRTPYLRDLPNSGKAALARVDAKGGLGGSSDGKSPALLKLLSTDHMDMRPFAREMLLKDVQILTRYLHKLEAETKQLKIDTIRLDRLQQQIDSRLGARDRTFSSQLVARAHEGGAGNSARTQRPPSSSSHSSRPASAKATLATKTTTLDTKTRHHAHVEVEHECNVALKLACVLEAIHKDKQQQRQHQHNQQQEQQAAAGRMDADMRRTASADPQASVSQAHQRHDTHAAHTSPQAAAAVSGGAGGAGVVASGSGWRREPAVMYEVVLRNGTCRNAGTSASVWMTAAGHTASLPILALNRKATARAGEREREEEEEHVRLMWPLSVDVELSCTNPLRSLLPAAPLREAFISAVAETCGAHVRREHVEVKRVRAAASQLAKLSVVSVRVVMGSNKEAAHSAALALKSVALLKALAAAGVLAPTLHSMPQLACAPLEEQGAVIRFLVTSPLGCLGQLQQVQLGHDGLDSSDAWFCLDIAIRPCHLPVGWTVFVCNRWVKAEGTQPAQRPGTDTLPRNRSHGHTHALAAAPCTPRIPACGGGRGGGFGTATAVGAGATAPTDEFAQHQQQVERLVVYEVAVTTGAERGAGTSAEVYLSLFGEAGALHDRKLECNQHDFHSGSTSLFYFVSAPLGSLTHLRLTHDSSGFSPAWLVKQVEVRQRRWRGRDTSVTIPAEEDDEHAHAASVWHAVLNTWLSVAGNLEVTCQLVPGASGHDRPLTNTTAPAAAARTTGAAPPAAAAAVRSGAASGGGGTRPRDAVPPEFCCAISGKVMRRPVLAADGYTYEREEIEARIRGLLLTSPVTNEPLADLKLVPNRVLEALIAKY